MIAIVDYEAGNLTSVRLAFEALGVEAEVTGAPDRILAAERVVFPGVGAAGAAMANLSRLGLTEVIRRVAARGTPFLGICLGTQIILSRSEEDGGVEALGLIPGTVRLFRPAARLCKVPQIGWNAVRFVQNHAVLAGIEPDSEFYFVHSYYPQPQDETCVLGRTAYADVEFAAVLGRDNIIATQFHPEKSGRIGLRLLRNFSEWDGRSGGE
ncbi:MAG: imidazole glycerol phosphate synthase subunit HisH [Kiritimatiellae bacterium]|nr:imidazole glycerol phosphate synthase subunit HisH [Kiritimatiellia bacterium]